MSAGGNGRNIIAMHSDAGIEQRIEIKLELNQVYYTEYCENYLNSHSTVILRINCILNQVRFSIFFLLILSTAVLVKAICVLVLNISLVSYTHTCITF